MDPLTMMLIGGAIGGGSAGLGALFQKDFDDPEKPVVKFTGRMGLPTEKIERQTAGQLKRGGSQILQRLMAEAGRAGLATSGRFVTGMQGAQTRQLGRIAADNKRQIAIADAEIRAKQQHERDMVNNEVNMSHARDVYAAKTANRTNPGGDILSGLLQGALSGVMLGGLSPTTPVTPGVPPGATPTVPTAGGQPQFNNVTDGFWNQYKLGY